MSVRDRILEIFKAYKHDEEYLAMMVKFRGLMRTYQNLEDTMRGKPPKKRKRRADTSADTTNPERTDS